MTKERSREYAKFLLIFVFLGFIMKIFSEFIHEMGHTFMVLMLGGKIIEISIRAEWPFALSHTQWAIPNPSNVGLALVAIAGILFETMTSIIGQSILILRRKMRPVYAISLFWLSFWTYLSPVVYLLMGAFHPFGDILDLMNALPVSCYFIGSLGIVMLIICTYLLSYALRDIFSNVLGLSMASDAVNYFWAFLHVFFILVTIITYGLPTPPAVTVVSMVAIFIWSYITAKWLFVFVSRQGGVKRLWLPEYAPNSMSSTPIESRDRKLKLGYVALFSVALISMLMTGFIINQYLSAYSIVMKTNIEIDVVHIDLGTSEPILNLSVNLFNPTSNKITLDMIEIDIKLNDKFIQHQVLISIPPLEPESHLTFNRTIFIPKDRMFTIDQAMSDDSWEWSVSGSGYVTTMFGETLLRFKSDSICGPKLS